MPGPRWRELGAEGHHHERWQVRDALHQQPEQRLSCRVDPMDVLVEHQDGAIARCPGEAGHQDLHGSLHLPLWAERQRRVASARWDRQQRCDQRYRLMVTGHQWRQEHLQPVEPGRGGIAAFHPRGPLQLGDHRIERAVEVIGRAVVVEHRRSVGPDLLPQRLDDARLADPRLARQQHHLTVAILGPGPALEQDAELVLTPDQRREMLAVQRFEAALSATLALDPKGSNGLGEALEMLRTEIGKLEQPTHEPPGTPTDDDDARFGERLEARRQVRGLANHGLLLRPALADQLADHDQTGGDADPSSQRFAGGRLQSRQRIDDREPGPDRPLGIVLMRPRPPEVGQHTIAHVLGDVALPALDHLGAGAMIGADHVPHVLGVEPRRKLGRADQVTEQQRQLPPLGLCRPRSGCGLGWRAQFYWRCGSRLGQGGNRIEQLAPVPDGGDANVFEIVSSQLGQDLGVNLVLPERLLVALQPQLA